jgi:NAD dependent epimerase/dehydratase family enzyme
VVGTEGGLLTRMLTPFEYGLGGPMGSGQQWMSWIERDDLIRLIAHALAKSESPVRSTRPRRSRFATARSPKNSAGA